MKIMNGTVFTEESRFEPKTILTEKSRISHVLSPEEPEPSVLEQNVLDASDCYVIPGLTDLHFHGCVGYDFCDGTREALQKMAVYELQNGITSICPASMTLQEETLAGICRTAASYAEEQKKSSGSGRAALGASLLGIHLEGPFLSYEKRGAQNPAYLQKPDADMLRRLQKEAAGLVRLVSVAPEEEGALECIEALSGEMTFSIAHTTADYETARAAMEHGALHVTHLYNAMPPFTHRKPGVIGAAADTAGCDVELICDGVHIAPPVVRATFRLFGDDRVILISDSMMATGLKDGLYALGGQPVTVKGSLATLEDGTIAGSATNLMDCMRTAVRMGIPLESAVKAAAVNPARSLGIYGKYGSLRVGKYANLVLLNKKDLSIRAVVLEGEIAG